MNFPVGVVTRHLRALYRNTSHGELLEKLLRERLGHFPAEPVLVESGCGLTTRYLADVGRALNATVYSCDYDENKIAHLKHKEGSKLENVNFLTGESLASLRTITQRHAAIHFVFLDSAPSAMHTFREFQVVESHLPVGACVLIDNASVPGTWLRLGPTRKGKVVVPYLLASRYWELIPYPRAGDSMVFAVRHGEPRFGDPACEHPHHVDRWEGEGDDT